MTVPPIWLRQHMSDNSFRKWRNEKEIRRWLIWAADIRVILDPCYHLHQQIPAHCRPPNPLSAYVILKLPHVRREKLPRRITADTLHIDRFPCVFKSIPCKNYVNGVKYLRYSENFFFFGAKFLISMVKNTYLSCIPTIIYVIIQTCKDFHSLNFIFLKRLNSEPFTQTP